MDEPVESDLPESNPIIIPNTSPTMTAESEDQAADSRVAPESGIVISDTPPDTARTFDVVPQEVHPQECVLDEAMQAAVMKCAMRQFPEVASPEEMRALVKELRELTLQQAQVIEANSSLSHVAVGLSLLVAFLLVVSWVLRFLTRDR